MFHNRNAGTFVPVCDSQFRPTSHARRCGAYTQTFPVRTGRAVPAESGVQVEVFADCVGALREALREFPMAPNRRPCAEASRELGGELIELGTQTFGATNVCEALGLFELRAQVVDPCAVLAAGALVRAISDGTARQADRQSLVHAPRRWR